MRRTAACVALLLEAAVLAADGGRVRGRQEAGPFTVTVFTAPEPLTAGPADVSVLVQDRASGEVLLDARVEVRLTAPGARESRTFVAGPGTNRLLKSAAVFLPNAGLWAFEVVVRRAADAAAVSGTMPVEAPAPRLVAIWPFVAAPPVAVALFALGVRSRRRRRGK